MKQTFLLQEVIDDLVNMDKTLSSALMKLNYFGRLIKNNDLIEYTGNELNGYRDKDEVPEYRQSIATIHIDIQAMYNQHSGILPTSMIEEPYRSALRHVKIREGIAAVEKLASEIKRGSGDGRIFTPMPMEMLFVLQEPARRLYKSDVQIGVVGARIACNSSIVVEIPNAIRTRLLNFVMSIADTFGYDIEIESFNKKADANNKTIIHQMHTTINNSGDGNVINTGNQNQIESVVSIYKGDIERLRSELQKQGIEEADIQEISQIVLDEKPNDENGRLGERANAWISKVINKSLNGIGKIATSISANILATLIKDFYGM